LDLRLDTMSFTVGAKTGVGLRGHGGTDRWFRDDDPAFANILLADGPVRAVGSSTTPPATLRSLLLRNDDLPAENP
jgi:hypothetical protein